MVWGQLIICSYKIWLCFVPKINCLFLFFLIFLIGENIINSEKNPSTTFPKQEEGYNVTGKLIINNKLSNNYVNN